MSITRPIEHPDPSVSVVIPTIPENEYTTPDTLRNQSAGGYEVIIVSDGSINRCEARNQGIKAAKGEIIAQTDDDCRPHTDWIHNIQKKFITKPNTVILGGCLDKHPSGPHRYIGANIAYRKEEAIAIGGFDTNFSGWRADTDFGWRMEIEYGIDRCLFDSDIEVEHIGPLRTNVNRKLEQRFRKKYPIRYFALLYSPDHRYGEKLGYLIGVIYTITPSLIEVSISIRNRLRSI